MKCLVCGSTRFRRLRSAAELEQEAALRERFVTARLGRTPEGLEAMDLTHFMHERSR